MVTRSYMPVRSLDRVQSQRIDPRESSLGSRHFRRGAVDQCDAQPRIEQASTMHAVDILRGSRKSWDRGVANECVETKDWTAHLEDPMSTRVIDSDYRGSSARWRKSANWCSPRLTKGSAADGALKPHPRLTRLLPVTCVAASIAANGERFIWRSGRQ